MARLAFRKISLSDKGLAQECLSRSNFIGCEYTFGNNYAWANSLNVEVCFYENYYFCKTSNGFIFPAGGGNTNKAVDLINEWCAENNAKPVITANKKNAQEITMLYENARAEPMRDAFDYVYSSKALANLSGKRYHSKRNHIARFCENNWQYEPIDISNIDECFEFCDTWRNEYAASEEMEHELNALSRFLESFEQLGLCGGLLRVDGKACAFTFGEKAGNVFVTHAEKALRNVQGAYAAINREFARTLCDRFDYINREDDAGADNLRKAKLSYYPEFLEEKYVLTFGG